MHQSKLIELLQKLPARQLQRFGEFLRSPFFNKNTENELLFNHLLAFAPGFDAPELDKSAVAKALELDERVLAYRMSELFQLLEQYLQVEHLMSRPLEQQLALMEAFDELELDKHFKAALRKAHKLVGQYPYHDGFLLQYLYRAIELENRHSERYERNYREELQRAADALDRAYLSNKLRYTLEMVNQGQILDIDYQLNLGEAVLQWVQQQPFEDTPVILVYLNALLMLQQPENTGYFDKLYALLRDHKGILSPAELKNLYAYLLNYCTRRINQFRDESFYIHFLEINDWLLEKGLLLEDGQLAPWRYSNLITVGLRTGRFDWASKVLHEYREYLPEGFRENIYNYNLGHYLYWKGEYGQAQVVLNQLDLRDLLLAVAAKNLLAKIYYETGQTELLLSFLEAYRIYVYRQPLAKPKLKGQVRNFIEYTRKLAKLAPFEVEKRRELAESLPPATEVLEREWLAKWLIRDAIP
ncbi:MAG: hypothetical protein KDC66_15515 [Phaeodactylibacter sp.]|nr:hypothetical protein [Phaeodactylibacter sp.]MCB9273606.1 hypothetical protein [Lewinellaceae bacterium]